MIIVAILKHVAGKSADYGAALDYLKYEHDEVLKKPLLDANGNWVLPTKKEEPYRKIR